MGSFENRLLYHQGKSPRYPLRGLSRAWRFGEKKNLLLFSVIETNFPPRPARNIITVLTELSRHHHIQRNLLKTNSFIHSVVCLTTDSKTMPPHSAI